MSFDGPSDIYLRYMRDKTGISDAFDLLYLETENGQGNVCIRVCSSVAKFSGNQEWPHWNDEWHMIVDGERLSLTRCAFRRKTKKLFIESLKFVYLIDYQLIKYYEQLYSKL